MKYWIVIFILTSPSIFAQSFTTKISTKIIGKEDVLQVEYIADNASMDQFNMPQLVNWSVVSGPNVSSSKIISGSTVKEQTTYSLLLLPKAVGTIIIPGASALINNKPQRSNDISVQVKNVSHVIDKNATSNQPTSPLFDLSPLPGEVSTNQYLRKGENPIEKIKRNMFVKLEVSKQSCFVGEPILATYKLCTRLRSNSKVVKQPTFSGCTVVELTPNYQDQHIEKINGQEYNVFVIRRVQLIPLNAGQLILPSTSVENNVSFYKTNNADIDIFGNSPGQSEDHVVNLENKPSAITIKPLPSYSGEDSFNDVVGNFSLALKAAEQTFTTSGTNHLFFLIEGTGNLQSAKAPIIEWPKGIEAFDPSENEETDKEGNPIMTRKVFTFPFVADKTGNFILPPIRFTFFDPSAAKYVTKSTQAFLIKVEKGTKNSGNRLLSKSLQDFDQRLFVLLGAGLLAVVLGIAWYSGTRRRTKDQEIVNIQETEEPPTTPVEKRYQSDGINYSYRIRELVPETNNADFYKQLGKNLNDYLYNKFQINAAEINTYAAAHENISPLLIRLSNLIEDCKKGMYVPIFNMEEALLHRVEALDIVNKLDYF